MKTEQSPSRTAGLQLLGFGFLILFLELSLIRYLAGNIWNMGYFPNLVLISTFLGMGAGFSFHQQFSEKTANTCLLLSGLCLLVLITLVSTNQVVVPGFKTTQSHFGNILFFTQTFGKQSNLSSYFSFLLSFFFVILINFSIAVKMAKLFRLFKPLKAYTLDIVGSCIGIAAFTGLSALQAPAWCWFAISALVILLIGFSTKRLTSWLVLAFLLILTCFIVYTNDKNFGGQRVAADSLTTIWSPYQKIQYNHHTENLYANNIPHQATHDKKILLNSFYSVPYLNRAKLGLPPVESTLILGSGTGNDAATAVLHQVNHVDAVEIDPAIAHIGEQYNQIKPYENKHVTLHINDGRAFLAHTKRHYDLIIFALTDSVVRASSLSQLRLENYLFTYQSVKTAYEHLTPNGQLYFYNYYRQPWIAGKIEEMLHKVSGHYPKVTRLSGQFYILSIGKKAQTYQAKPSFAKEHVKMPTDNWPFFYMKQPSIPTVYFWPMLFVALLVLLLLWAHKRCTRHEKQESTFIKAAFLMMGMAFLLLETKGVIQFSLLFGNTWLNNSLVFFAVLILILIANWIAYWLPSKLVGVAYLLLVVSSISVGFYSIEPLLGVASVTTRFFCASLIIFSPIFFANCVFGLAFKKRILPEHIFGWNLLGAVFGGILEYCSMLTGYQALSFVAAGLYIISFACFYIGLKSRAKAA